MNNEIYNEINEHAPELLGIRKSDVHPESNYFDDMQNKVLAQIQLDSTLPSTPTAPHGYFDTMQDDVIYKLGKPKSKVFTIWKLYAVAASLTLIVTCGIVFKSQWSKSNLPASASVQNVSDEELIQYLDEENIDSYIDELAIDLDLHGNYAEDLQSEEIEDVLSDEAVSEIESLF